MGKVDRACRPLTARLSHCGDNVGFVEIVALVQERLARDPRERISEAITEIQTRRMATLAKIEKSLSRKLPLFNGDRFNNNSGFAKQHVGLSACIGANLPFNNHRKLDKIGYADGATAGIMNKLKKAYCLGFFEKNGN